MVGNVITANFRGARTTTTSPLWQYDYGQFLRFTGVSLPDTYEVHFSNNKEFGQAKTSIGTAEGVLIPDEYLVTGKPVFAWIFLHVGEDDGETVYMAQIPVRKRSVPSDEPPTPQEQSAITQAIAALNSAVVDVQEAVDAADSARASATSAASSATAAAASEAGVEADADRASTAATAAESAQTAAETAQTGAESARDEAAQASVAQIAQINATGAAVLESIPADYTELSDSVSDLKSELTYTQDGNIVKFLDNINYLYGTPVDGKYVSYESGNVGTSADWAYYPAFEIEPNTYYYGSYSGGHVAFFDASGDFISGVLINNSPSNPAFKTPATAKTMTYSYLKSSGNQYVIKSIDFPLEYIDALEKMLNDDVNLSISHFTPIASFGKNLFNRFNTIEGYCPDYVDGSKIWRNASYCYCPDYVEVKPSTTYHFNQLCVIAEYDKNKTCVQTNNKSAVASGTITTTTTTKYLKIGTQITKAALLQVEEGDTGTNYQPFGFTLPLCFAPSIKTVSADGTKQFKTISDAVSSASEGDIILVYDGVYTESVKAYSKKLHIIGTNKAKCILTYSGRDYSNPPLEMAKGSVRNITIIATDSGTSGTYNAYCVHIDNDNEANEALTFTNVDFINGVHQAVGIGLRHNFTLTFDLCRFKAVDHAALYCHDWETNDADADKTGQKLIVRNCSIVNNSASKASIMLQSQELIDEGAEAVFIGNTVINNGGGSLISMTLWAGRTLTNDNFMGSSDWVLSVDSALNSTWLINSSSVNLSYTALTPLLSRVANVDGGYCKIDKIVYVNVKFTSATGHTGTPSVLGGLPKPLTGNAVLSAVRADSGIGSSLQANVLCGIANTSLYVDTLVNSGVYFVTGSYIAE